MSNQKISIEPRNLCVVGVFVLAVACLLCNAYSNQLTNQKLASLDEEISSFVVWDREFGGVLEEQILKERIRDCFTKTHPEYPNHGFVSRIYMFFVDGGVPLAVERHYRSNTDDFLQCVSTSHRRFNKSLRNMEEHHMYTHCRQDSIAALFMQLAFFLLCSLCVLSVLSVIWFGKPVSEYIINKND